MKETDTMFTARLIALHVRQFNGLTIATIIKVDITVRPVRNAYGMTVPMITRRIAAFPFVVRGAA